MLDRDTFTSSREETPVPDYETLAGRYIDNWNDKDPASRRTATETLWAQDASYIDPLIEVHGHDGIEATIAAVQSQFPSLRFRLTGPVDGHHNQCRFGWELGPEQGDAPVAGFDVAVLTSDGTRLQTVLGFLDRVPAT
jgi:hypothetical protein